LSFESTTPPFSRGFIAQVCERGVIESQRRRGKNGEEETHTEGVCERRGKGRERGKEGLVSTDGRRLAGRRRRRTPLHEEKQREGEKNRGEGRKKGENPSVSMK
jgi:hypothetical protein